MCMTGRQGRDEGLSQDFHNRVSKMGFQEDRVSNRSSNSIVGYAVVYILRLIGHTHDRERPMQNFSTELEA